MKIISYFKLFCIVLVAQEEIKYFSSFSSGVQNVQRHRTIGAW